ncbi:MAG: glycosyl transferase family 28 [Bacteroidetes bacterium]|nr:glycosyl transferase family 28 [Bacteroidota bacterium]
MESGCHPVFAGNEWQQDYIKKSIGGIETIHLDGYQVRYATHPSMLLPALLKQMPALIQKVKDEHQWLKKIVLERHIDGILSDNRYGLHHAQIPSVLITHQLQIKTGLGRLSDSLLQKLHYRFINRFSSCWVVDEPSGINLSGDLAHPASLPNCTTYIGLLSQFEPQASFFQKHLLVLLSGPEPQRSILSERLWKEVLQIQQPIVFVEGSSSAPTPFQIPEHITYRKLLTYSELLPVLNEASLVICRSGYSTLMDLVALKKPAIVIPTPGQTEQLYLAKHLHRTGVFFHVSQNDINLKKQLATARDFSFLQPDFKDSFQRHRAVLSHWISTIN